MPVAERVFSYASEPAAIHANRSGNASPTATRALRKKSPNEENSGVAASRSASAW